MTFCIRYREQDSSNDDLVNHLTRRNLIRTAEVERVHRAVDRARYVVPVDRGQAYLMRPWRRGPLHLSAPSIYGEVLEALELRPGLSFLNVGSGTGYLSTMAGLIIGPCGINHGVEVELAVVEYANKILEQFIETAPVLDETEFCDTKFFTGNGLCLGPQQAPYDRLYCGAECSLEQFEYFKRLIKIGGVLVLPLVDRLVQVKRTSVDNWTSRNLLHVVFADLKLPTTEEAANPFEIEVTQPPRLKVLCCVGVRKRLRTSLRSKHALLRGPILRRPPSSDTNVGALLRLVLKKDQNLEQIDEDKRSLSSATTSKNTSQPGRTEALELESMDKYVKGYSDSDADIETTEDEDELTSPSATDEDEDDSNDSDDNEDQRSKLITPEKLDCPYDGILPFVRTSLSSSAFSKQNAGIQDANHTSDDKGSTTNTIENELNRSPNCTHSPKQSNLFHDSSSSSIQSTPSLTSGFSFRSFEQTKNVGGIQENATDTSNDKGSTTNTTEKKLNSSPHCTDSSKQSNLFHDSTSSSIQSTPSLTSGFSFRSFEQTKNVGGIQGDATDTSNDKGSTTNTTEKKLNRSPHCTDSSKQSNLFHDSTSSSIQSTLSLTSGFSFHSFEQTKNVGGIQGDATDTSNDKGSTTNTTEKKINRSPHCTDSSKQSNLFHDSTSSSIQSTPSLTSGFSFRSFEQTKNVGGTQENATDMSNDKGSTTNSTEKKLNRSPHCTDSSKQSNLFHDSTSSSMRSTPSLTSGFSFRFFEQTKNVGGIQGDATVTSNDKGSTTNITEKEPLKQSPLFHDSTSSTVWPNPVLTFANPFDRFLEQTKNAGRIENYGTDMSDDTEGADNTAETKRIPLLFDVRILRSLTEDKNKANMQAFSEKLREDNEMLDSGMDEDTTTSNGSLIFNLESNARRELDVQCSIDKNIDGLAFSTCPRDVRPSASTSGLQAAVHDRDKELQEPNEHKDAQVKSSQKHPMDDGFLQKWSQKVFAQKNVMPDFFARSKIFDRITLSTVPLAKTVQPVTVPVSFKSLPAYIDEIWDTMQSVRSNAFSVLDNTENKVIFKKGAMLLAEVKVAYAQRTTSATPDEDLPTRKAYTEEELKQFNQMAAKLPLPLALYLECLGTTKDRDQVITPILAKHVQDFKLSGAITWSPRQMVSLLQLLRKGVPSNGAIHQLCLKELDGFPMLQWEQFYLFGNLMVRITEATYNFWITMHDGTPAIKWDDNDRNLFIRIVQSLNCKIGFNVDVDLSHGIGSPAQLVQTIDWSIGASTRWFTMVPVDDSSIELGVGFGFSRFTDVQPSKFTGSLGTAYMRGEITPSRIMSAILHNL